MVKKKKAKKLGANFYFYFIRLALTYRTFQIGFGSWSFRITGKFPWKAPSPNPWAVSGWDSKRPLGGLWGSQGLRRRRTNKQKVSPSPESLGFSPGCSSLCLLTM